WSFLHWLPNAAQMRIEPAILRAAKTVQATGMVVHQFDDHLSDGQMPVSLVTLQFRTIAWQRFLKESRWLCERLRMRVSLIDEHTTAYLTSLHRPSPTGSLDVYCRRFIRQIGIWTLVPRIFGRFVAGPRGGNALTRIVEDFGICWRVLDDIQDAREDVRDGN